MTTKFIEGFFAGFEIDRASPVPAYYQLQDWLAQRIDGGDLSAGDSLPSEREFSEQLGISRMTVRQALERLTRDGRLIRQRGTGTFVGTAHLVSDMSQLRGVSAELAQQGRTSLTRVLGVELLEPPRPVAVGLGLAPEIRAIRLRRVRSVDHEPLSFETSWLHPERCMAVLDVDLTDRSLNQVLTDTCGLQLAQGNERITATTLDSFEADQLAASPGTAAFRVQRTTWTASGEPVEVVVSVIRGDRFAFEATLGAPHETNGRYHTPTLSGADS
ncbi:GntR family transcriptional regulator [soil metagenome]